MSAWRRFQRWLVHTWAGFFVPLYYAQEGYHMGVQVLFVSKWGRKSWEVYAWHNSMASEALHRHFAPLPFGSSEYYHRLQLSAESGVCRLVGRYGTWKEARDAR